MANPLRGEYFKEAKATIPDKIKQKRKNKHKAATYRFVLSN